LPIPLVGAGRAIGRRRRAGRLDGVVGGVPCMPSHVRNASGLSSGPRRRPRSRVSNRPCSGVCRDRRLASRSDADLSPSERSRRLDGLPRPVVLGMSLLEYGQDALDALAGPLSQHSTIVLGPRERGALRAAHAIEYLTGRREPRERRAWDGRDDTRPVGQAFRVWPAGRSPGRLRRRSWRAFGLMDEEIPPTTGRPCTLAAR
jgi:hypothetical protein